MIFKLYDNKSSVLKKNSRYVQGGETEVTPNILRWWERRTDWIRDEVTDISITITPVLSMNEDLISSIYYERPDLGWFILQYNNIVDTTEELIVGRIIVIPEPRRLFTTILTKSISYSQR